MTKPAAIGSIPRLDNLDVRNRRVFLRLDFNVPLGDPDPTTGVRSVQDQNRILGAIPTINWLIERQAKIIIASHLGRPDGKAIPEFSLEPVAIHLAKLLEKDVKFSHETVGDGVVMMTKSMGPGEILVLENLRFHPGEESNDPAFSAELSELADIYVTDAFGTAHRKHASTFGVAQNFKERGCGLLIDKEVQIFDKLLTYPEHPYWMILGGAKISDKVATVINLLPRLDGLLVGGAMAFSFLRAMGKSVPEGAKPSKQDEINSALQVIQDAKRRKIPLVVAEDFVQSFDIGPKTLSLFKEKVLQARTIFWNGPMGWFENPPYEKSTFELASTIAGSNALKIVGGGDTVAAVTQAGLADRFDHLSTGGGASLEYLEGKSLPGIEVLRVKQR